MKRSMKLISMLTVIALLACVLVSAIADDRIFTSEVFVIPKDRVEWETKQEPAEEGMPADETGDPEVLPEEDEDEGYEGATGEPEEGTGEPEETTGEPEDTNPETEDEQTDKPVERQVRIKSSRKDIVIENEIITLTSELIGFEGVEVRYQWQVDRGDGLGWVDVEGATGPQHSFVARRDTILYNWRLIITTDE